MANRNDEKLWFSAQVKELSLSLYRLARSIVRSDADAQDAVQEAVTSAWEHLGDLRDREKFRPWIMRITVNCATQICRGRSRLVLLEDAERLPAAPEPEVSDPYLLRRAVEALPEDMRAVVVLFYYDELSVAEISRVVGEKPATVKTRLFRARQKLKGVLGAEGYNE